jgi:hypothetical protein
MESPRDLINTIQPQVHDGSNVYLLTGGVEYEASRNRIHLAWVRYNGTSNLKENLYYAYLNLKDNHMYSISGVNLGTTITQTEADANCKIVNSGSKAYTEFATVRIDSTGKPYIIYTASTIPMSRYTYGYNFTRWTGSAWTRPVRITATSNNCNSAEFFILSSTSIEAYLVGSGYPGRGGDIQRWSWDGSTWTNVLTVLAAQSSGGYGLDEPMRVYNGRNLRIVFCQINVLGDSPQGSNEYTISNLNVFAYDGSGTQLIVQRR